MFSVVTLKLILWWVQRHGKAILAIIGVTVAVMSPDLIRIYRLSVPIESRVELTGRIVSVRNAPANPKMAIGRGHRFDYVIRLPDGRIVWVSGPANRPHATGERVTLTRFTRVGGRVTYEFADNPLPYRSNA
jgi:hypothetical protein